MSHKDKGKIKIVRQSGVLPFRCGDNGIEILLITSRTSGRWVIPKGMIEPGMNPARSAEKEGYEEAGIKGTLIKKRLGDYKYEKSENKGGQCCKVEVYPIQVTDLLDDWPEKSERTRKWVSPQKAAELVNEDKLKKIIGDCPEKILSTVS